MPKAELPPTDDSIFAIMDDIKKRSDFIKQSNYEKGDEKCTTTIPYTQQ